MVVGHSCWPRGHMRHLILGDQYLVLVARSPADLSWQSLVWGYQCDSNHAFVLYSTLHSPDTHNSSCMLCCSVWRCVSCSVTAHSTVPEYAHLATDGISSHDTWTRRTSAIFDSITSAVSGFLRLPYLVTVSLSSTVKYVYVYVYVT